MSSAERAERQKLERDPTNSSRSIAKKLKDLRATMKKADVKGDGPTTL
jgi:hypothetical protein